MRTRDCLAQLHCGGKALALITKRKLCVGMLKTLCTHNMILCMKSGYEFIPEEAALKLGTLIKKGYNTEKAERFSMCK